MQTTRTRAFREGNPHGLDPAVPPAPVASDKQVAFIQSLLEKKVHPEASAIQVRLEANEVTKKEASKLIDELKAADWKPRESTPKAETFEQPEVEVPAGRYAITGEDGTTDFYKVDRPTEGKWKGYCFVKLILGGGSGGWDSSQRIGRVQQASALRKIAADGPKEAAIRYGREIGRCSCCGRTLTNPESIELGIGPICAGRQGWL